MRCGAPGSPASEVGIVTCVAAMAFTFQFDAALVTVSLPDMARELSISAGEISTVLLSYLNGAVIAFMPAGKLGDRYGLRNICLSGCLVATIGTVVCGFSHSLGTLLAGRFVQGIGAGSFVAVGYAMIPAFVSANRVGWGYGMQSIGAGIGMLAGVPAGGLLSQFLTWQWIFLASIPVFAGLLGWAWWVIPPAGQIVRRDGFPIPWVSLALLSAVMIGVTILLGGGAGLGLSSPSYLTVAALTVFLAAVLWLSERGERQLVSRDLVQFGPSPMAYGAVLWMAALVGGVRFLLPFYLEVGLGVGILASSYLMLVHPLCYGPASLLAGTLADRLGSRPVVFVAASIGAASALGLALFNTHAGLEGAVAFIIAFGISTGLFFAPANRLIMMPVPKALRGEAGGMLSIVFNFGTLLGVAVFQLVLTWFTSPLNETLGAAEAMQIDDIALKLCFVLGGLLAVLALICILLIPSERSKP